MASSTDCLLQCQHSELAASKSVTLYPHDQLVEEDMGACRLEARLMALEREHRKIDAFKRELPLCMQLLHHAIEACKEQLALYRSSSHQRQLQELVSCSFDDRNSVVQNECRQQEPISISKQPDRFYTDGNEREQARVTQVFEDAFRWMKIWNSRAGERNQSTISLEEGLPWYVPEQASAKAAFSAKKKLGGAFVPYNRLVQPIPRSGAIDPAVLSLKCSDAEITGQPNRSESCKIDAKLWESARRHDNSSAGMCLSICTKRVSNSQQQVREAVSKEVDNIHLSGSQATRKARRSWSPELHRLFVDALQKLGGAQATPKQIRELMNVEGLTNDEVKSHLQKYRLHARRLGALATSSSQSPGVLSSDRAWVLTENASHARGTAPISYNRNSSKQSQSCETSITQEGIYCWRPTHSQTSSCCKKQLHSRNTWQGTDVGGEESVGEAARPENWGSKGRLMHESDEMEDHSFSGNQTQSLGEGEMGYEDDENRSML